MKEYLHNKLLASLASLGDGPEAWPVPEENAAREWDRIEPQAFARLGHPRPHGVAPLGVVLVGGLAALLGFIVGKAGIVLGSYVAQVPHDVHDFVVAQQRNHFPVQLFRLPLSATDQPKRSSASELDCLR